MKTRLETRLALVLLLPLVAFAPLQSAPATATPSAAKVDVAADAALARLIELGRHDHQVSEELRHLCVEIGPRLTSSTRLTQACEWTRDQFASFGLAASLERWGEFPVGFDRGPWHGGMVAPEKLDFVFHTMAWTPGTNGPKRGPALRFPKDDAELAAIDAKIAGAWLVRAPAAAPQPPNDFVRKVQERIVERGGLGEVRGARGDLLVTDGNFQVAWDALPKLVQIRVRKDHHDQLWSRLGKEQEKEKEKPEQVELEFDVDNRFVKGPIPLYNVVADLKGTEKPDEFVIVSGHLDSWDGAQGTVDNGTGCATTLEAARLLAKAGVHPKRTIRFVLWSGEEQGCLGSVRYVEQHAAELPKVSAVLVHDDGTNYLSGLGVTAAMLPAMKQVCAPLEKLDARFPFQLTQVEGLPPMIGSDNDSFTAAGVPGLFWNQAGRADYEHCHHTQYDTLDAAIPEYQEHSSLVVAVAAYEIAQLPQLLDRTDMKAMEPRRMGVQLDGTKVAFVMPSSRAEKAGLKAGDVIVAVDGAPTTDQEAIRAALQSGSSKKTVKVERGGQPLEFTFDWSDDPDEARRLEKAKSSGRPPVRRV
jgi:hypothetical protein